MNYQDPKPRKSLHGRIVQELGLRIVSGQLLPGERLPSEALLIEAYAVSRPVLREATRVLTAKGLVTSKPRVGSVVRQRSEWHMLDPDVLCWMVKSMPEAAFFDSLLTVRRIIEPACAALAASNATESDLAAIGEAYERMANAGHDNRDELIDPDIDFHRRIAEATHNDLLAHLGSMLSLALRESIKLTSRHPDTHALSLPRHRAILTALRERDPLGARHASMVQLESARRDADEILEVKIATLPMPADQTHADHPAPVTTNSDTDASSPDNP